MLAELVVIAGAILLMAAVALLWEVRDARRRVAKAGWLLTRADAAISEARRASISVGGLQLVDHLLGVVARDGEADPNAAR